MIIGIDIDNVCYSTTKTVLQIHYEDTGEYLTLDVIKSYDMSKYVSSQYQKDFYKVFGDSRVWERAELIPNCAECIKQIHETDHKVYFVTSTTPENVLVKANLLRRDFPFIDINDRLIITKNKQMIKMDVLIDDCLDNFTDANYDGIILDYPWNKELNTAKNLNLFRLFRRYGWSDIMQTIEYLSTFRKERMMK